MMPITPHIAYSVRKGTDFEALEQEARNAIETIHKNRDTLLLEQKKLQTETKEILDSMRRAAAEAGVSQHSIHFKEEAMAQAKSAWWWLGATVTG